MRRLFGAFLIAAAVTAGTFVGAAYATDENAPHGGPGSHPHHVHKGNGECEDLDQRYFEPSHRGLHRASNESGTESGPYHGTCADHSNH